MLARAFSRRWFWRTSGLVAASAVPAMAAWGLPSKSQCNRSVSFHADPSQWVALTFAESTIEPLAQSTTRRRRGRARNENRVPSMAVQTHLEAYGINVQKLVQSYPPIASYDLERVQKVTSYLNDLQVDVKRVVEAYPRLLSGQVDTYNKVVELLRHNDVNVARAVNLHPAVLTRGLTAIQNTMDAISSCGHSVARVVNRCPSVLRSSKSNVSAALELQDESLASKKRLAGPLTQEPPLCRNMHPKAVLLSSLGLDADWMLRKMPQVLTLTVDKCQRAVNYLNTLGVDVPKVVRLAPVYWGPDQIHCNRECSSSPRMGWIWCAM
eukprot:EG_transcript_13593